MGPSRYGYRYGSHLPGRNPHPWEQVWVSPGKGTGTLENTHGLPLPITNLMTRKDANYPENSGRNVCNGVKDSVTTREGNFGASRAGRVRECGWEIGRNGCTFCRTADQNFGGVAVAGMQAASGANQLVKPAVEQLRDPLPLPCRLRELTQ